MKNLSDDQLRYAIANQYNDLSRLLLSRTERKILSDFNGADDVTTGDVMGHYGVTVQMAHQCLDGLVRKGYAKKSKRTHKSGGLECVYNIVFRINHPGG